MWPFYRKHPNSVGVIVARFQVPDLTKGHRRLIKYVRRRNKRTLIVLGDHGGWRTPHDPLTYEERVEMVRESFPGDDVVIVRLYDHPWSNERWAAWLDALVDEHFPAADVTMYGSRDSFIDAYTGRHSTHRVPQLGTFSGTAVRASLVYSSKMSARAAIIYVMRTRGPIVYSSEDVAVLDPKRQRVLLITKPWYDGKWSLMGGMLDATDPSDMAAAQREKGEELPRIGTSGAYVQMGDRIPVDDPRYRASNDGIMTTLFRTFYESGELIGGDDAKAGVRWFERHELRNIIVPWHLPLVEKLEAYWQALDDEHWRMAKM